MLHKRSLNSVEIISVDYEQLIRELYHIAKKMAQTDQEILQILLFGSLVNKDYTPDSDIDILILVRESNKNFLVRSDEYRKFFSALPMDVDIKVYTWAEVQKMLDQGNPFIKEVIEKGIALYANCKCDLQFA